MPREMPQQLILQITNGKKEILIPANADIIYKIDKKNKYQGKNRFFRHKNKKTRRFFIGGLHPNIALAHSTRRIFI